MIDMPWLINQRAPRRYRRRLYNIRDRIQCLYPEMLNASVSENMLTFLEKLRIILKIAEEELGSDKAVYNYFLRPFAKELNKDRSPFAVRAFAKAYDVVFS